MNNCQVEEETDKKYNDLKTLCENLKNQISIMKVEIATLKSQTNQNYYEEKNEMKEKECDALKEKILKYEENRRKLNEFIEEKGKSYLTSIKDQFFKDLELKKLKGLLLNYQKNDMKIREIKGISIIYFLFVCYLYL